MAVRDEFMDVSDEEVSDEDDCLSRSMAIKLWKAACMNARRQCWSCAWAIWCRTEVALCPAA